MKVLALFSTAALPAGRETKVQAKVSGLPSTSEERLPLRVTGAPRITVWLGPALATGGEFTVLTVTVDVSMARALLTVREIV